MQQYFFCSNHAETTTATTTPTPPRMSTMKEGILNGSPSDLTDDLRFLLLDTSFSDVKFMVGPLKDTFHCHKCILSARCSKFREMFNNNTTAPGLDEESIVLLDTNSEHFRTLVRYIYTNSCTVNDGNVMDVLLLALEYQLPKLVEMCEKFIVQTVTTESVCHSMQAALSFKLDNLKRLLLAYFDTHTSQIVVSNEFNELSAEALEYILQSDGLCIDEYQLVMAVKSWATVNAVATGTPVWELAHKVVLNLRLPLLTPQELESVEHENSLTKFVSIEQISTAWKHIALRTPPNTSLETTLRSGSKSTKSFDMKGS